MADEAVTVKVTKYEFNAQKMEHAIDLDIVVKTEEGWGNEEVENELISAYGKVIDGTMIAYLNRSASKIESTPLRIHLRNSVRAEVVLFERAVIEAGLALGKGSGKDGGVELLDTVVHGIRVGYVKPVIRGRVPGNKEIGVTFLINSSNLSNDKIAELITDCGPGLVSNLIKVLVGGCSLDNELEDYIDNQLVQATISAAILFNKSLKEDKDSGELYTSVPFGVERYAAVAALGDDLFLSAFK